MKEKDQLRVVLIPKDHQNILALLVPLTVVIKKFPGKSHLVPIDLEHDWLNDEEGLEKEIQDIQKNLGLKESSLSLYLLDVSPRNNVDNYYSLLTLAHRYFDQIELWLSTSDWPMDNQYLEGKSDKADYADWLDILEKKGYTIPYDLYEVYAALLTMPKTNPRAQRLQQAWNLALSKTQDDLELIKTIAHMVLELASGIRQKEIDKILKK